MDNNNLKFKILPHTADLKIKAFGKEKQELFLNMLKGMASVLQAEIKDKKVKNREIKVESTNLNDLLVDFLNEALYLTQVNREVYENIKFEKFTDTEIKGELVGQKVERFEEDIKAATYHQLDIQQRKDGIWEATVIFDV
ncbi:MAG: archease [Patescibacteria group bacterium]|nr:archease [Patescibacteria group bacterium]